MAAHNGTRSDFDAARLRDLAKRSSDPNRTQRLIALAIIREADREQMLRVC